MTHRGSQTRFKPRTCNTIDDVTGLIEKLSNTHKRWDNIQCTQLNMEPRQPQDFPVIPLPPKVYVEARPDVTMPVPTAYTPGGNWTFS